MLMMTRRLNFARPGRKPDRVELVGVTTTPTGVSMSGVYGGLTVMGAAPAVKKEYDGTNDTNAPIYPPTHMYQITIDYHAHELMRALNVEDSIIIELKWALVDNVFPPYDGPAQQARRAYLDSVRDYAPQWYYDFYPQLYGVRWIRWDIITCFGSVGAKFSTSRKGITQSNRDWDIQRMPTVAEYFAILDKTRENLINDNLRSQAR